MRNPSFFTGLLSTLLLLPSALAASADDWRSRSIYQVVTDRFALTNDSSVPCDTGPRKYCGGTWAGITNHLDYIQSMGFDAVWISPVVANLDGETAYGEAYHGYWSLDINALNSHFGTADDLKNLSSALHSRGMYLMLDVVVNHMGATALPPNLNYSAYTPFSVEGDYHAQCFITDYNNQTDVEQCWLGDTSVPLPDIDTEDPTVVSTMNSWITNIVKEYSVDGVRIDTVKHVRKDFWPGFASAAGAFTIGEVLHNETSYVATYTQVLDSVLDYPTWFSLTAAFTSPQGNLTSLASTVVSSQSNYKNGEFMTGSFLENQDQPRFQSITQDQSLVKNAMTWPFVHDGIPILYYGQEQGYTGSGDPNNREALWFTAYQEDKPLVKHVTSLNAARKVAIAANKSYLTTPMKFLTQTNSAALAISKPPLVTLLTNAGNASSSTSWTLPGSTFKGGETVVDLLTCNTAKADSSGGLVVQANSSMPQVLISAATLKGNSQKLCDNVAATSTSGAVSHVKITSWFTVGGTVAVIGLMSLFA